MVHVQWRKQRLLWEGLGTTAAPSSASGEVLQLNGDGRSKSSNKAATALGTNNSLPSLQSKPTQQHKLLEQPKDRSKPTTKTTTEYVPRRSSKLSEKARSSIRPDGNTWVELLVHSRRKPGNYRSLFYCIDTRHAYWEEPPTGASEVVTLVDFRRRNDAMDRVRRQNQQQQSKEEEEKEQQQQKLGSGSGQDDVDATIPVDVEEDVPDTPTTVASSASGTPTSGDDSISTAVSCIPAWPQMDAGGIVFDEMTASTTTTTQTDEQDVKYLSHGVADDTGGTSKSRQTILLAVTNATIMAVMWRISQKVVLSVSDGTSSSWEIGLVLLLQVLLFAWQLSLS